MDPHFDGVIFQTHAAELRRRMRYPFPPFRILDVRSSEEYQRGHLPGAVRVDAGALAQGLPEGVEPATEFFVVGAGPGDERVRAASVALRDQGARRIVELGGGVLEWRQEGLELEGETARAA